MMQIQGSPAMDTHREAQKYPRRSFCSLLRLLWFPLWSQLVSQVAVAQSSTGYLVGTGSYDITGPAADVNMMGYGNTGQSAAGVHIRLYARVFIVAEVPASATRVVFVNLDACMASIAVTLRVLSRLQERYGELYTAKNVAISGTHTHSGPGGYLQYVLYLVTSLGFVRQSFEALADGIELAIVEAHENLRPGSVFFNKGDVLGANINRSPSAYLQNPSDERATYNYDVDKEMSMLKFVDAEMEALGAFSWFPVHGTSMNRTNQLISGDNKGAASRFMEDWFRSNNSLNLKTNCNNRSSFQSLEAEIMPLGASGRQPTSRLSSGMHKVRRKGGSVGSSSHFVSAFCQSNVGDTTPNTLGAFCLDSGLPCDFQKSTCNGRSQQCVGRGPAFPRDHFESTRLIGEKQAGGAIKLFQEAKIQVLGKISFTQAYVNMSSLSVNLPSGEVVSTCPAAVGFSFAAGTTDGPGAFDFTQGDNKGNLFWRFVGGALHKPSVEQINCHKPKPILLDTGEISRPYAWTPSVLPIQILQIGQFIILSVPGEMTTMAGRRLRAAVKATLVEKGRGQFDSNTHVVIAGLAGDYSQYITTFEEYQVQRYEGASTLFGPHTLQGYIQEFQKLATALAQEEDLPPGPQPPNLLDKQIEFLPGVMVDTTPTGGVTFGDLKQDVPLHAVFRVGETVAVVFHTANPRNDLLTEGTFAVVEILRATANATWEWEPVYDDDDWSLKFLWNRFSRWSAASLGRIEWTVPNTAPPGVYRIRHFGACKTFLRDVEYFTGASSGFRVTA